MSRSTANSVPTLENKVILVLLRFDFDIHIIPGIPISAADALPLYPYICSIVITCIITDQSNRPPIMTLTLSGCIYIFLIRVSITSHNHTTTANELLHSVDFPAYYQSHISIDPNDPEHGCPHSYSRQLPSPGTI